MEEFYDIEVGEGEGENFEWWFKVIGDEPASEQRYGAVETGSMWMERVLLRFGPGAKSLVVEHYSGPEAAPEPLKTLDTIVEELRDPSGGHRSGSGPYRLFATPALAQDVELLRKYVEEANITLSLIHITTFEGETPEVSEEAQPEEGEEFEVEWLIDEEEEEGEG